MKLKSITLQNFKGIDNLDIYYKINDGKIIKPFDSS